MLGTKMYIDTNKYKFNVCIQKIIDEINNSDIKQPQILGNFLNLIYYILFNFYYV
jgi:hypothetical protein